MVIASAEWREKHLSPSAKVKVRFATEEDHTTHAVSLTLPNGAGTRTLEAGREPLIHKGVMEDWASKRLQNPFVVSVSEPGDKIFTADAKLFSYLRGVINASNLLPDALVADLTDDTVDYWIRRGSEYRRRDQRSAQT